MNDINNGAVREEAIDIGKLKSIEKNDSQLLCNCNCYYAL